MSSTQQTVDFLTDQMVEAGKITSRKMFGEYAIYCDGKVVAFVCDEMLFFKPIQEARDFIGTPEEASPYPGAKNYFKISTDRWDDSEWLTELVRLTAAALPLPKPKKSKLKPAAKSDSKATISVAKSVSRTATSLKPKKPKKS